jgi:hypothetical protein
MAVSIKNCPKCRTMLFSDTVQCPACQHVLDPVRYQEWSSRTDGRLSEAGPETACPKCGEMVRDGLVRCWKCSTFMREEIAEEYRRMQAAPQPVIYSPLPDGSAAMSIVDSAPAIVAEDDDFELGSGYRIRSAPSSPDQPPPASPDGSGTGDDSNGRAKTGGEKNGELPPPPDVAHSIATGGDALLQVALAEQKEELAKRRKRKLQRLAGPRSDSAMLVFCPNGHRIEVDVKYRGMTGRCPKCKSPFIVPLPSETPETDQSAEQQAETTRPGFGKFTQWMDDVHIHAISPEKLKLKAGSLKGDFQLFDLAFAEDELLAASYSKKKGAAHEKSKKTATDRDALQEYLKNGGPVVDAPAADKFTLTAEQVKAGAVVQPSVYAHESMFAGIPVFGEWLMAIRLPLGDDPASARFASFPLSGFRRFVEVMQTVYGVENLCQGVDVPLEDTFTEAKCHYSDQPLKFLENVEYYQADPAFKLKLVGRKCQACGLAISEDSRKKEKIGGANGKAIAKAKCPKCQQKFGTLSLFTLEVPETPEDEKKPEAPETETVSAKPETQAAAETAANA